MNLFEIRGVYILSRLNKYAMVDILTPLVESDWQCTPDDYVNALNGSYRNSSLIVDKKIINLTPINLEL